MRMDSRLRLFSLLACGILASAVEAREAVAFICAHPDDLAGEIGTALLLSERYDVHVIDYTHGERGLGEAGHLDGSTRKRRTAEEERVCAAIGARLHWLEEVDGDTYVTKDSAARMTELLKEIHPKAVIMHWPVDIHCDHMMSSMAAWRAILFAGLRDTAEVYFHEQTVQSRSFRPNVFVDITRVEKRKEELIRFYECQWPETIIDRKRSDAIFWGHRIGAEFAEAYVACDGTVKGAGVLAALGGGMPTAHLQTAGQRAYFSLDRRARENAFSNAVFRASLRAIGDKPNPVVLDWAEGKPPYAVVVTSDGRLVRSIVTPLRTAEVFNLEIAREYVWTAKDASGQRVGGGAFRTADEAPRFMNVPGVPNMRDLGGRFGLGGRRIRQGLVYRSAGWNENAVRSVATNGASVVTNWVAGATRVGPAAELVAKDLGIRTDLDLRSDSECRCMSGSPLGRDVRWIHVSSGNYWEMTNETFKAAFAADFRVFLDRANYPIVFHCIAGADRTGSLACILNALLGVGEDDLAKDWEATGFANGHPKLRHDIRWNPLIRVFDGYPGATLIARIEAYVRDCGLTDDDIRTFRGIMLSDRPKEVEECR